MKRLLALAASAALVASAVGGAAPAMAAKPDDRTLVVGTFNGPVVGKSYFRPDGGGQTWVVSSLRALVPGKAYFTVVYGNNECDPRSAFPAGPVFADRYGRATLVTTISTGDVDLRDSKSVSVREADYGNDIDQDGIFGPIDVVATVGSPAIGLVQCTTDVRVRG